MDRKVLRMEKKLTKRAIDDDGGESYRARRLAEEEKKMREHLAERAKKQHMIAQTLEEVHKGPVKSLSKAATADFHAATEGIEERLRSQTYGLVTLEEFRKTREQIENDPRSPEEIQRDKRKREEEELKQKKSAEREKKIKLQAATLSFDLDA